MSSSWVQAFINSPVGRQATFRLVGPKTTHFWGPVANWGFVLAGVWDMNKPAEKISTRMTAGILCE